MFIIIHGPLETDFLFKNLNEIQFSIPHAKIIVSIYNKDVEKANSIIEDNLSNIKERVKIIGSDDVFNPGFFNINRQINLVKVALNSIDDDNEYVLKIRMDQTINFKKMLYIYNENKSELESKIVTTNCYTRKDRLYHPSDMFLAGTKKVLNIYYPADFFVETHMDSLLRIKELVAHGQEDGFHKLWPESRLFINYLINSGEKLLNTQVDSQLLIKKYVYVINSWDIGLKWKKFLNGKFYVLPYFFEMRPFEGGPLEKAENYLASELDGYQGYKFKELIMNLLSQLYFKSGAYVINPVFFNFRLFSLRIFRKLFDMSYKFVPPILHTVMYKLAKRIYYALK